jgi:hypothetical protein
MADTFHLFHLKLGSDLGDVAKNEPEKKNGYGQQEE